MLKNLKNYLVRHRESRLVKKAMAVFFAASRRLFRILPIKYSIFIISATRLFDRRISYFLASDFRHVLLQNKTLSSNYSFSKLLTGKLPLQTAGSLVRLGMFKEVNIWLTNCGSALKFNDHFLMIALDYLDWGKFDQAKTVVNLCIEYNPSTSELQRFKGLIALLAGNKDLALFCLRQYAKTDSAGWCPHQNIAARYPDYYQAQQTDINSGDQGLLFDAYNFLGQRVIRVGRGELCTDIFGKALEAQAMLMKSSPVLSDELQGWLKSENLDFNNLRIIPWEWVTQVGHLGMLEILFRMRDLGWWAGPAVILAPSGKAANKTLLSLFKQRSLILQSGVNVSENIANELFSLQRYRGLNFNAWRFPDGEVLPWQHAGARLMLQWEVEGRSYPLRSTFDEHYANSELSEEAVRVKAKWGMKPDDWYVCLHVRDSEFYGEFQGFGQSIRNCDLDSYMDAVRYITEQGGWVIKLGGANSSKLPEMPRVVNYAHTPDKSEFMDLHLIRHARFFIGTTSGLTNVAISFNVPCALVNCVTNDAQLWSSQVRYALKPVIAENGEFLTPLEITSTPWRWRVFNAEVLRRYNATILSSSADEILETVKEVNCLAQGNSPAYLKTNQQADKLHELWRASLAFPEFYGAALPSLYYLQKYEKTFLVTPKGNQKLISISIPAR